ncbi:MAG: HDOD domain-containing protein [Oceanospirillales bacterium]|nr:HDOD domain-containing protein [Oceanospirillales bacterium]
MTTYDDGRYCIALHPICDRQFHHVGDELLYRANDGARRAVFSDPLVATARASSTAFYEIGLESLVGSRMLFLNVSAEWLLADDVMSLPSEQVVIDLPDELVLDDAVLARLETMRASGFAIAATDRLLERLGDSLLAWVNIVKLDMRRAGAFDRVETYRGAGRRLLAAFVELQSVLERCLEAPFDYLQGYFYSLPHLIPSPPLERRGNRAAARALLKELFLAEPEVGRLETLLAQDPHLCAMLFRQLNSASARRGRTVSSVGQAIMMLGFDKIRALTATLLLADNQPIKRILVFKALVRADLARRLSRRVSGLDSGSAFTVGLFSMIDQVEGMPLADLVKELGLNDAIAGALLEREGDLGRVLQLVEAFEQARLEKQTPGAVDALNREYLESVAWTQEVLAFVD